MTFYIKCFFCFVCSSNFVSQSPKPCLPFLGCTKKLITTLTDENNGHDCNLISKNVFFEPKLFNDNFHKFNAFLSPKYK